jgi:hypothetical protein
VFAGVAAANMTRDGWREPLTVLMVAALGLAVVINASPGADVNHLLDFYVVALLFVASQMTRGRLQPNLAAWSIAVAASLTMVAAYLDLRHDMLSGERAQVPAVRALVRDFREPGKPIFSADAMLPSLEGERSYMLDNWMYQFLRRTDPRYDSAITSRIASGDFGVVVLQTDPADARTAELYGQGFVRALNGRYEVAGRLPPYVVLRPKHGAEQRRASEGAGAVRSHVE